MSFAAGSGSGGSALDRYFEEISQYPLITSEEEARLAERGQDGDLEALDALVRANLRFVVSIARKYQGQGVPLADLINEGNLGLIRAAYRFDGTRGVRFISYAVWWIRQAILKGLAEQSRIMRIPLKRANALHRIGKSSRHLFQELGREPTPLEIARDLETTTEEVLRGLRISRSPLSLDAPWASGEETSMLDFLPDELARDPEDDTYEHVLREIVEVALESIDPREAKVLRLYFGLDDQEPMTLEEIGAILGVTRERVRQINEKGLDRLRHRSRSRLLRAFAG